MNLNKKLFFKINSLVGQNRWLDAFGRAGAEWVIVGMIGWYVSVSFILNYGNLYLMWLPLLTLAAASIIGWIFSNLIAEFVQEVRPRMRYPEIKLLFWPLYSYKSFPSDHSFGALTIFLLALIFNLPTAWFLLPLALWVGFGRVYAGVHYPADVLGGFILSGLVSTLLFLVLHFYHFL